MAYRAKKPRKKRLRVKIEKMWYVSIVDESDNELTNDYSFGTREDAVKAGNILKKTIEETLAEKERLERAVSEAREVKQAVRKAVRDREDAWDMVDGKAVACSESCMNPAVMIFHAMNDIGGAGCSQESSSESF